jgi:hypothetical protein
MDWVNKRIAGQRQPTKILTQNQERLQIAQHKYTKFRDLFQEQTQGRDSADSMFAVGAARDARAFVGSDVAFQGAMVSTMIFTPANTLSISPCTRPTSDLRNACSC